MSDEREALGLALQALGQKERSVAELGSWLRQRGVAVEQADEVVAHLVETEVLDDARFASRYAEDKRDLAGWGSERIRTALIERGIAAVDAEAALAQRPDEELERAIGLLRDRGEPLTDDRSRSRALGLLARRGYDAETAYEAIRQAAGLQ